MEKSMGCSRRKLAFVPLELSSLVFPLPKENKPLTIHPLLIHDYKVI